MDDGLRLSEEQGRDGSKAQGPFSHLKIKDYSISYLAALSPLYADFFKELHGREPRDLVSATLAEGPVETSEIQADLYYQTQDGAKIRLAFLGDRLVGFMIFHYAYRCILFVHALYVVPELRKSGALWEIIHSVGTVKKIYSQNFMRNVPKEVKESGQRGKIIHVYDDIIIWEKDPKSLEDLYGPRN